MGVEKIRRRLRVKGALRVEGAATFDAAGTMRGQVILTDVATRTLIAAESGSLVLATKTSATQTFTLPAATVAGCWFMFKVANGAAGGELLIDPAGTDILQCKAANDAGAEVRPAGGTGLKNTAATNVDGDYLTLMADGVDTWHCVAQSGIWATQ